MTYGILTHWVYPYTGVMNTFEAKEATADTGNMIVQTKTGGQYRVYRDTVECYENGGKTYVYGERINAPRRMGPFNRKAANGTIKWFLLKNVRLVS